MITQKQSLVLLLLISSATFCTSKAPVIRSYKKDADETALIAIFKENPQYLLGTEWGATEKEQLAKAKAYLASEKYTTLVLEVDSVPVGFVNYMVYPVPLNKKVALLHLLGVSKGYKRRGYGLLLMKKALEMIKKEKPDYVQLIVKVSNKSAIALYTKLGFNALYGSSIISWFNCDAIPLIYRLVLQSGINYTTLQAF